MAPAGTLRIFGGTAGVSSAYITYGANGFPRNVAGAPAFVRLVLYCDDRGNKNGPGGAGFSTARLVQIDQTGRAIVNSNKTDINNQLANIPGAVCPLG